MIGRLCTNWHWIGDGFWGWSRIGGLSMDGRAAPELAIDCGIGRGSVVRVWDGLAD